MKKKEEIMEDENIDTTKEIVTIKKEGFIQKWLLL